MKRLLNGALLGIVLLGLLSCSDDDMGDMYSTRGAEEDKNMLDSSSKDLKKELVVLGETEFAAICLSMSKRIEGKKAKGNMSFFASIIHIGKVMSEENQTVDSYFDQLTNITFNEDGCCNALRAGGYGTWQWDNEREEFVMTKKHENEITFKFPATDDATNGDTACLTVTKLELNAGKFPNKGAVLENGTVLSEISTLRFNIKIKDELILTGNISNQFDESGYFKIVGMTFNPIPFMFTGEMGCDNERGYWVQTFKRDEKAIIEHDLEVWFDDSNDKMPISRLTNSLIINKIQLITEANTGEIYSKLQEVEALPEDSEEHAKALAKALNEYAFLTARYTNDRTILAKVHAEAEPNNKADGQNGWWVDLKFEFSDGSQVSGEEYYEGYLSSFKIDLENLVTEFKSKFGV